MPARVAEVASFVARRALRAAAVLFAAAALSFVLLRLAPGGPFSDERGFPPAVLENLRARYHLDLPVWRQFVYYIGNLTRGDLGPSLRFADFSVNDLVAIGLPSTLLVGASALTFALAVGIPLGAAAALRRGSAAARLAGVLSVAGLALPNFVLGPLLVWAFSAALPWFEPGGLESARDLVLPTVALGLGPAAVVTRLTRAGLEDVLSQDFVRAARAKGLPERLVLWRHALRGGLAPVLTYLGPAMASILTGSLVVESVFSIPGIGTYLVNGALNRDYPLVLGIVLLGTAFLVVANMLVDALYRVLDPRVRVS